MIFRLSDRLEKVKLSWVLSSPAELGLGIEKKYHSPPIFNLCKLLYNFDYLTLNKFLKFKIQKTPKLPSLYNKNVIIRDLLAMLAKRIIANLQACYCCASNWQTYSCSTEGLIYKQNYAHSPWYKHNYPYCRY